MSEKKTKLHDHIFLKAAIVAGLIIQIICGIILTPQYQDWRCNQGIPALAYADAIRYCEEEGLKFIGMVHQQNVGCAWKCG